MPWSRIVVARRCGAQAEDGGLPLTKTASIHAACKLYSTAQHWVRSGHDDFLAFVIAAGFPSSAPSPILANRKLGAVNRVRIGLGSVSFWSPVSRPQQLSNLSYLWVLVGTLVRIISVDAVILVSRERPGVQGAWPAKRASQGCSSLIRLTADASIDTTRHALVTAAAASSIGV